MSKKKALISGLYISSSYKDNFQFGGSEGDRTLYLLHAMEALSQVSYRPVLVLSYISFSKISIRIYKFI